MPLLKRVRAAQQLPPPRERRAIRDAVKASREDIARELRRRGIRVTGQAILWWEREKTNGGFDPRPATAIAYARLLKELAAAAQVGVPPQK